MTPRHLSKLHLKAWVRVPASTSNLGPGFDLLGLQQVGMSLEEIFLHLTTTEAVPSASAVAEPTEVNA